jgi:hypothetical protein
VIPHLFQPLGTINPAAPMIAIRPGRASAIHSLYRMIIPPAYIVIIRIIMVRPERRS